ncbi:MAG: prolyl aminopeptidase [Simkania sp.]|nr:prolyl aminopeptidase [Simkania sp.]
MLSLYPPIQPYLTGFLPVSPLHTLYFEECGNPLGKPILFLHGGPGSGLDEKHRQYFDPKAYRIILFDQRGCGKSTPHASIEANTTWDLVADIETLRKYLNVDQWIVFGGSWGSTLALTYAIQHPQSVQALILRGVFLNRPKDLHWFYQYGAHFIFPDAWENYFHFIPEKERQDMLTAYYIRLTSSDPKLRRDAAIAWSAWEGATLKLRFDQETFSSFTLPHHADAIARIECHYFINKSFFPTDNWIVDNIEKIRNIPGMIIHGRYDVICPLNNAWQLHHAWPESKLDIIPDAGHSASEPGIANALIQATNSFR